MFVGNFFGTSLLSASYGRVQNLTVNDPLVFPFPETTDAAEDVVGAKLVRRAIDISSASLLLPRLAASERIYQRRMVEALGRDDDARVSPWLGLASPMQTGKSHSIGPIVDRVGRRFDEILVVTQSRIVMGQILEDLEKRWPGEIVGRFDGVVKDRRRVTVASAYSLVNHLDDFDRTVRSLLIFDEAYFTPSPTSRAILTHFGLGREATVNGRRVFGPPESSDNLLIGLSGTAAGLENFRVSARLDLVEAIECGWVRQMNGEQAKPPVTTEERRTGDEAMVWWHATRENAAELARVYVERIHRKFEKPLLFVPTVDHGNLLAEEIGKLTGGGVFFAHSREKDGVNQSAMAAWAENRGPLISVRMLARGFRGTGAGAIFHTYQTTSEELFAQRTGRGWGNADPRNPLPDLYVLEAVWDRRARFSNLARVLGLVDYPGSRFSTREALRMIRALRTRRQLAQNAAGQARLERIEPSFERIPVLESWRDRMSRAAREASGDEALANASGLPPAILGGFLLGGLAVRRAHVLALQKFLGGEESALSLWVDSWEKAWDQASLSHQERNETWVEALSSWRADTGGIPEKSEALDGILRARFPRFGEPVRMRFKLDRPAALAAIDQALSELAEAIRKGESSVNDAIRRAQSLYDEKTGRRFSDLRKLIHSAKLDPDVMELMRKNGIAKEVQASLDSDLVVEAFRQAVSVLDSPKQGQLIRKARELYCSLLTETEKKPSVSAFHNYVERGHPEIAEILRESGIRTLEKPYSKVENLFSAYEAAFAALESEGLLGTAHPVDMATKAHALHAARQKAGSPIRKITSFLGDLNQRSVVYESIRPFIERIRTEREKKTALENFGKKNRLKIARARVTEVFGEAIAKLGDGKKGVTRRQIALQAHTLYCASLEEGAVKPSEDTFIKYAIGHIARPEVVALFDQADIGKVILRRTGVRVD